MSTYLRALWHCEPPSSRLSGRPRRSRRRWRRSPSRWSTSACHWWDRPPCGTRSKRRAARVASPGMSLRPATTTLWRRLSTPASERRNWKLRKLSSCRARGETAPAPAIGGRGACRRNRSSRFACACSALPGGTCTRGSFWEMPGRKELPLDGEGSAAAPRPWAFASGLLLLFLAWWVLCLPGLLPSRRQERSSHRWCSDARRIYIWSGESAEEKRKKEINKITIFFLFCLEDLIITHDTILLVLMSHDPISSREIPESQLPRAARTLRAHDKSNLTFC